MEATMYELMANGRLDQLKKQYAANLPDKVRKAAESIRAFMAVPRDRVLLQIAHRFVHSLTGSSGTYGFYELSRIARGAEELLSESLESGLPLSSDRQLQLRDLIFNLGFMATAAAGDAGCGTD
jgi:chemotaxis protein histidine kinase CheA